MESKPCFFFSWLKWFGKRLQPVWVFSASTEKGILFDFLVIHEFPKISQLGYGEVKKSQNMCFSKDRTLIRGTY